jgi:hypothetical protein
MVDLKISDVVNLPRMVSGIPASEHLLRLPWKSAFILAMAVSPWRIGCCFVNPSYIAGEAFSCA